MTASRNPDSCDHAAVQHRIKTRSDSTVVWHRQCVECGTNLGAVKKATVAVTDLQNPVAFDEELLQSGQEIRWKTQQHSEQLRRNEERKKWFEEHNDYLRSERWAVKRRAVLQRDGNLCQACRHRAAKEVHHLTYDHWGDEPLFDLISICRECHRKLTDLDRTARQVRADLNEVWRQRLKQQA